MSATAGWYDDPRDPANLRYWDGVMWTDHVTPKQSPTLAQSHIGEAYPVPAAQQPPAAPAAPAAPSVSTPSSTGQSPWQGSGGYTSAPQWQQPRPMGVVTTPDGVETAGWGKRVLARILDIVFALILSLPFTGWFVWQYARVVQGWVDQITADAQAGRRAGSLVPPAEAYAYAVPAALIALVVYAVYEVAFLTRTGATPGKKIVGISVRLREAAGPPPIGAVLKRFAVWQLPSLLGLIPIAGSFLSLFQVVDALWPLWDPRRQALHDKVAKTNVVLGPQPRSGKSPAQDGSGGAHDRPADQLGSGSR